MGRLFSVAILGKSIGVIWREVERKKERQNEKKKTIVLAIYRGIRPQNG